jgi:hypothetical protein
VASGSVPMTVDSSGSLADGRVTTTWTTETGDTVTATGPQGTVVQFSGQTLTVTPPEALTTASVGNNVAPATPAPPPNHSWFNALDGSACGGGQCVYGSSEQYSLQEIPGAVYIFQKQTGTVYNDGGCEAGAGVYNEFPGSSGDSGPQNYSPNGDSTTGAGSYPVGFGAFGFSYNYTVVRSSGTFGPIAPHDWGNPAFGSRWLEASGTCAKANQGLGSADNIKIGSGQSDWDALVEALYS